MADSGAYHQRPREGFRFKFGGVKTNSTPDAMPPDKYPYAQNIRSVFDESVRTRWGLSALFPTGVTIPTDINSYTTLQTDNYPRFLARTSNDSVYLSGIGDSSTLVGSLAGGGGPPGASMIPFRPAQSPNPWMYIANGDDYQKFSAPAPGTGIVTQQKVGIAEPQLPCEALIDGIYLTYDFSANPAYAHTGVASAATNQTRITDTVAGVYPDPAGTQMVTIGVATTQNYTRQMVLTIGGEDTVVQDVYSYQSQAIGIAGIYYFAGTSGRCVVVPQNMAPGPGTEGDSIYSQSFLGSLRRGSLVQFSGGSEICIVWNVVTGPEGTVSFETSTVGTHTSAETFTQPAAVQVANVGSITNGASITAATVGFNLSGAGIGAQTSTAGLGQVFVQSDYTFQPEDYFHVAVAFTTLASLVEFKILLDVGDGSFTGNFYYYTIRVSDIQAAVNNTLTQLGAAQLVSQRALIDQEQATTARNQGTTQSGDQMTPGDGMWADILFPISSFTRVGTDTTKSLQTVNAIQLLFNMSGATDCSIGINSVVGGGQPDVGPSGAPYRYRVRPRSGVTGTVGNPSPDMRYGVNPRRAMAQVNLPSAIYDTQIDTWDIFRYGGTVTSWRKIGQTPSTSTTFIDNYDDNAALAGDPLDFDNLEPWPSIDLPLNVAAVTVVGTTAVVPIAGINNALRYLPGNLVRLGSVNVYTLRVRPTLISAGNYLFQFVENAGTGSLPLSIYEPALANQHLPYMWGPDAAGTVFAVGDPLRPGTVSFAKNFAPDNAPDSYNIEITPPSEPLLGGETIDGLSFVASPERWWAMYPQQNPAQRYSIVQQPLSRGLAAPFGHCNDGKNLYWWAKDSIQSSSKGSLTDADLYNIFPHDGVPGVNYTYNGNTIYAPDYKRAGTFRLCHCNGYLYATYQDSTGVYRALTLDLKRMAWVTDVYTGVQATVFYHQPQQEGSVITNTELYPTLVMGTTGSNVFQQQDLTNDVNDQPIVGIVSTMEWDGGDTRAGEEWGDLWLDCNPAARGGITATPVSLGAPAALAIVIPTATTRVQTPVSVGGALLADFLGMQLAWSDDYDLQSAPTVLHIWQPSFLPKPETIGDRFTDWYDGGTEGAKYVQGFLLHADTFNAIKALLVYDSDTLTSHLFNPAVQHNGESVKAYSFNTPFIAHLMRIQPVPQDTTPWRFFDVEWVFEPTSEAAETWQTQGTAHGLQGYMHVKQVSPCYASMQPVTLTITSFDGQSPQPITLPATGGAMQKATFILTANKGQLYFYAATSSAPFQLFLDSWEIEVGQWARQDNYLRYRNLGGKTGDQARV